MFDSHDLCTAWAITLAEVVLCCHLCTLRHPHDALNEIKAVLKLHETLSQPRGCRDCALEQSISRTGSVTHGPTGTEASAAEEEEDAMVAALKRSAAISRRSAALV